MSEYAYTVDTATDKTKSTYTGRKRIVSSQLYIGVDNVVATLRAAYGTHMLNRADINYLYNYYKGNQPILNRKKDVRAEICNKIVENHADEIVAFKVGYLIGEPVVYTLRTGADNKTDSQVIALDHANDVKKLNDYMLAADKHTSDYELVEWFEVCGTAYRLILPADDLDSDWCECPFTIDTLDPRNTFVVYENTPRHRPIMGVTYVYDEEEMQEVFSCWTKDSYFLIKDEQIIAYKPNVLGVIPIIEYPANTTRMGAFERVIPLLDAINTVESNRVDGVEQFVQALMVLKNVEIDDDEFKKMLELGAVKISSAEGLDSSVDMLTAELSQMETQTLVDHLYRTIMLIVGMPINQGGGASTSDTGVAVMMRDGWSLAETRAKAEELMFKKSENQFLRLVAHIVKIASDVDIQPRNVEVKFTRRNYEAIQSKAQVLTTMLGCGQIDPRICFEYSGMFSDPEQAYADSQIYVEKQKEENNKLIRRQLDVNNGHTTDTGVTDTGDANTDKKANQR